MAWTEIGAKEIKPENLFKGGYFKRISYCFLILKEANPYLMPQYYGESRNENSKT